MLTSALTGLVFLCSFVGWGHGVLKVMGLSQERAQREYGWGASSFLGLSVVLILGGLASLLGVVSRGSNIAVVGVGVVLWLILRSYRVDWRLKQGGVSSCLAAALGFSALAVYYLSYSRGWVFNVTDDYWGYLAWPYKLLETGSIGTDPFSTRRFSAMGGNSYLQSVVLSFLPLVRINLVEPAVSMLMLTLLFWERLRVTAWGHRHVWVIFPTLIGVFAFYARANTTSILVATGFIALMMIEFYLESKRPFSRVTAVRWALLGAALCSLKSTVAFFALASFGCFFAYRWLQVLIQKKSLKEDLPSFLILLGSFLVFLLPWIIIHRQSTGSWYYPMLGKGYYITNYGETVGGLLKTKTDFATLYSGVANVTRFPGFLATIVGVVGFLIAASKRSIKIAFWIWGVAAYGFAVCAYIKALMVILVLGCALFGFEAWKRGASSHKAFVAQVAGAWVCAFLFFMGLNGALYQRNIFAISYGAFLSFLWVGLHEAGSHFRAVMALASVIAFSEVGFDASQSNLLTHPWLFTQNFSAHFSNVLSDPVDSTARYPVEPGKPDWPYAKLQDAVPAGRTILARTVTPYLFDFSRHNVWIIDTPVEISLPPGMPAWKGPEALAQYFKQVGICYVAYSYGRNEGMMKGMDGFAHHYYDWVRAQGRLVVDFQQNLLKLGKSVPIIYDDGLDHVMKFCD